MIDHKTTNSQRLPFFAEPRPTVGGPYLIRNPRSARIIGAVDTLLALWNPNRSPPVALPQPRRILIAEWADLGNVPLALPALLRLVLRNAGARYKLLVFPVRSCWTKWGD